MEQTAENKKKLRRAYTKLIVRASLLGLVTLGTIVLWIAKGIWFPIVMWIPVEILLSVLLAKNHFEDTAFICAECNSVFKPPFRRALFTSGTPSARWLTCTKCGNAGYCAEVYAKDEITEP